MRKIHKVMIITFLSGIFLAGLGTGLALSEFSSFVYAGETTTGNIEMKTDTFEYTFIPKEDSTLKVHNYSEYWLSESDLVTNPSVPENTIRISVTYNSKAVKPYLNFSEEEGSVGTSYYYIDNEFENFMICKDQILKELKEKKISSYTMVTVEDIKVLVNPASAAYVSIN